MPIHSRRTVKAASAIPEKVRRAARRRKENARVGRAWGQRGRGRAALMWPLLLVITVLLPSLGMNLYLGWNLWESYNRRAAPPSPARINPRHGKSSHQHARHGHEKHSHEGHSDESKSAISR